MRPFKPSTLLYIVHFLQLRRLIPLILCVTTVWHFLNNNMDLLALGNLQWIRNIILFMSTQYGNRKFHVSFILAVILMAKVSKFIKFDRVIVAAEVSYDDS